MNLRSIVALCVLLVLLALQLFFSVRRESQTWDEANHIYTATKVQKARNLAAAKQLDEALQEAQAAIALAPDSIQTQLALGDILRELGQEQTGTRALRESTRTGEDY